MKFFFTSCQKLYAYQTAKSRITFYDAYLEIYKAVFAAVLYVFAEPARIRREYHADKSWKTILNPDYARLTTGRLIVAYIAIPCAILIAILFAAAFIIMLPFQLILFIVTHFLDI